MNTLQDIRIEPRQTVTCICCDAVRARAGEQGCSCDMSVTCLWCKKCFSHCVCVTMGKLLRDLELRREVALPCHGHDCKKCVGCAKSRINEVLRRLWNAYTESLKLDAVQAGIRVAKTYHDLERVLRHELSSEPQRAIESSKE